eukprot:3455462-Lingulodinium_polyedra.AAC.1
MRFFEVIDLEFLGERPTQTGTTATTRSATTRHRCGRPGAVRHRRVRRVLVFQARAPVDWACQSD